MTSLYPHLFQNIKVFALLKLLARRCIAHYSQVVYRKILFFTVLKDNNTIYHFSNDCQLKKLNEIEASTRVLRIACTEFEVFVVCEGKTKTSHTLLSLTETSSIEVELPEGVDQIKKIKCGSRIVILLGNIDSVV